MTKILLYTFGIASACVVVFVFNDLVKPKPIASTTSGFENAVIGFRQQLKQQNKAFDIANIEVVAYQEHFEVVLDFFVDRAYCRFTSKSGKKLCGLYEHVYEGAWGEPETKWYPDDNDMHCYYAKEDALFDYRNLPHDDFNSYTIKGE